jgi:hypothetical protein
METSNIASQKETHCHVDETWTHQHAPDSKPAGYGMETCDIASQKEVQNSTMGGKSDVDNFLGCTRGQTVNSVCYSEMLWEQLKLAI